MTNFAKAFPRRRAQYAGDPLLAQACATRAERELAEEICADMRDIRGLGQSRYSEWDATRWRDVSPCDVAELPECPCVSAEDLLPIGGCFAGSPPEGWPQELHDAWCAQTAAGMLEKGYCPDNPVPEVPSCLSPDEIEGRRYCNTHGFGGPNGVLNALCWAAMASGALESYNNRPPCEDPRDPGEPRQPTATPPPATEPPEEKEERGSFMVPGLILLLVVGGGTAYYLSQRKPKR